MKTTDIRSLVRTILEARIRETDITDGTRVAFGAPEHVADLEMRIADLERWRDRQRRGSEARANYARLIGALRRELRAAYRVNEPKVSPPLLDPELTESLELEEAVDMEDPEYSSVEDFVQFMLDDDRTEYSHEDLAALNFRTRMPIAALRKELEGYGFTLAHRAAEKQVRGFTSNSHDRWHGKGSLPTHGGAGIDASTGRATVRGRTV